MPTSPREQWVQGLISDQEYADKVLEDAIEICDRCGEEVSNKGDDAVSYCSECGVVEGNTHWEAR